MNTILCFTDRHCPFKGEVKGFEGEAVRSRPRPYYACLAKTLEQMQACILREDRDINNYGVKVLVRDPKRVVKAWDPKKVIVQRVDRDEQIDGQLLEKFEV